MTVIKCPKGHLFEKVTNPGGCPHCLDERGERDPTEMASGASPGNKDPEKTQMAGQPRKSADRQAMKPDDDERTRAQWQLELGEPICGWLVCYEGMDRGRDYRIVPGRNSIGRDTESDICIRGDKAIGRLNHAFIFFEMDSGVFYLQLDQGKVGIFLNNKIVLQPAELKLYDDIRIGQSKFKFVPLCSTSFRWVTDDVQDGGKPERAEDDDAAVDRPHRGRIG